MGSTWDKQCFFVVALSTSLVRLVTFSIILAALMAILVLPALENVFKWSQHGPNKAHL